MKCYDCAVNQKVNEAVGICAVCGRAVCLEHARMQHLPQHRTSEAGIGGPIVRLPHDRPRLLCPECDVAVEGRQADRLGVGGER